MFQRALIVFLVVPLLGATPPTIVRPSRSAATARLTTYNTKYYVIHTDLTGDSLREAELRMTKMAEEYHNRTRPFAGEIKQKLPFFLFKKMEDYLAAGGMSGTAGVFNPNNDTLMAVAGDKISASTWHVVQHEGFHQFAQFVIGGELPVWVNEGMAEYFGEGLFTGDGFVTGVVPPERLLRIKKMIHSQQYRPFKQMMLMAHRDWNAEMSLENYDQAWSMVQFLAHAENGKYQDAFVAFMRAIGKGQSWEQAWINAFGSAEGFEKKWLEYWQARSPDESLAIYAQATMQTLVSMLARATAQAQRFNTFDEFLTAVNNRSIKIDTRDWLPDDLMKNAADATNQFRKRNSTFVLTTLPGSAPVIVCTLSDRSKLVGKFKLSDGRVAEINVTRP